MTEHLGLKANQDSITEAAEKWSQKNGPLTTDEKLIFSVMRKSKDGSQTNFTPEEVMKVVKSCGSEQRRIPSTPKLVTGLALALVLYCVVVFVIVLGANGITKDHGFSSTGSLTHDGKTVSTGLSMNKENILSLVPCDETKLISIISVLVNDKGWSNYKVQTIHCNSAKTLTVNTGGGHRFEVTADKSVTFDGNLVQDASSVSVILASSTIII
jgi:hypothetical protein